MSICERVGCICINCKHFDDCLSANCWVCDEGRECIKNCNKYLTNNENNDIITLSTRER